VRHAPVIFARPRGRRVDDASAPLLPVYVKAESPRRGSES
jgi:hypothetical protein